MDRRDFVCAGLGTVAAIGIAPVAFAQPTDPRAAWDVAYANYVRACTAVDDFHRNALNPAHAKFEEVRDWYEAQGKAEACRPKMVAARDAYAPIEDHWDKLVNQRTEALHAMVDMPAPNVQSVRVKIEALIADENWECIGFSDRMKVLLADLRLLGGA